MQKQALLAQRTKAMREVVAEAVEQVAAAAALEPSAPPLVVVLAAQAALDTVQHYADLLAPAAAAAVG